VSKVTKILTPILRGDADANINFSDLRALLRHLGFVERIRGSHHIFTRENVAEILNLQPKGAKAKAYQVKQVRNVIISYGMAGDAEQRQDTADSPAGDTDESTQEENHGG
jgi:hypothetical protein